MNTVKNKIPSFEQIAAVYAVIVMLVYPWTLTRFFWKLSSWLLYSTLGDLANLFAYMMTVNFLESLVILAGVLAINLFLPRTWFHERFVSRGVSLVLLGLGYLIFLNRNMHADDPFPWTLIRLIPVVALIIVILVFLIDRVEFLRRFLIEFANRALIFLYISVPVSVVCFLIVLIRNIM